MLPELTQAGTLRVFMTTDAVGGVWQYSLDLAQGLRAYDTQTTLCVIGPRPEPEQLAAAQRIPGLKLIHLDLPLDWTAANPEDVLDTATAVVASVEEHDCDIVHLNSPILAAAVLSLCLWWPSVIPAWPRGGRPCARDLFLANSDGIATCLPGRLPKSMLS